MTWVNPLRLDEVAGYQEFRDRDELNRILEAYIAKELLTSGKVMKSNDL